MTLGEAISQVQNFRHSQDNDIQNSFKQIKACGTGGAGIVTYLKNSKAQISLLKKEF